MLVTPDCHDQIDEEILRQHVEMIHRKNVDELDKLIEEYKARNLCGHYFVHVASNFHIRFVDDLIHYIAASTTSSLTEAFDAIMTMLCETVGKSAHAEDNKNKMH